MKSDFLTPACSRINFNLCWTVLGANGESSFLEDGNNHLEVAVFLYSARASRTGGGRMIGADGGLCFRLCKRGTCTAAKDLLVDLQLSCLHIQIFPLERQQFPQSESSGQFQKEEFVVAFILSLDQQPLHLLTVQHLHLFSVGGWQFAVVGGIAMDQVLRRRLIQDLAAARRSFCRSIFSFRSPPLFSSPHDFGGFAILTCTSSLTSI